MPRLNYRDLLQLYMIHVEGNTRETFVDKRDAEWTDKEWAALVEIRNEIETMDFKREQAEAAARAVAG